MVITIPNVYMTQKVRWRCCAIFTNYYRGRNSAIAAVIVNTAAVMIARGRTAGAVIITTTVVIK